MSSSCLFLSCAGFFPSPRTSFSFLGVLVSGFEEGHSFCVAVMSLKLASEAMTSGTRFPSVWTTLLFLTFCSRPSSSCTFRLTALFCDPNSLIPNSSASCEVLFKSNSIKAIRNCLFLSVNYWVKNRIDYRRYKTKMTNYCFNTR